MMSRWSKIRYVFYQKFMRRHFLCLLMVMGTSVTLYSVIFQRLQLSGEQKLVQDFGQKSDAISAPEGDLEESFAKEEHVTTETEHLITNTNDQPVYIFDWTGFFGEPVDLSYNLDQCKNLGCKITRNLTLLDQSQAVIFHARDMNWTFQPETRHQWQFYVFFSLESPAYAEMKLDEDRKFFFNLSMTYRHDSDIPMSYGYFRRKVGGRGTLNISAITQHKTKMAAWFASNCQTSSGREYYVKALERAGISIDVYGACTDDHRLSCPRSLQSACDRLLFDRYKFYLSFENSLCKDYVTEKFYDRMKNFVVPIVLERRNYDNVDAIPPRSYIAVDDYPSTEHLARHLLYLDAHDDEYAKYLEWHRNYEVAQCPRRHGGCEFCDLCRYLVRNSKRKEKKPKILDLQKWWHDQGGCRQPPQAVIREYQLQEETAGLMELAFVFTAVGFMFVGVLFVAILAAFRCMND